MIAIADLVDATGTDIRFTRQQDVIIGNIPIHKLGTITEGMREIGLPIGRNKIFGNSIACTSHRFCNYSVAETKGKLQELLEEYDVFRNSRLRVPRAADAHPLTCGNAVSNRSHEGGMG